MLACTVQHCGCFVSHAPATDKDCDGDRMTEQGRAGQGRARQETHAGLHSTRR